jgi:hypothetical protein
VGAARSGDAWWCGRAAVSRIRSTGWRMGRAGGGGGTDGSGRLYAAFGRRYIRNSDYELRVGRGGEAAGLAEREMIIRERKGAWAFWTLSILSIPQKKAGQGIYRLLSHHFLRKINQRKGSDTFIVTAALPFYMSSSSRLGLGDTCWAYAPTCAVRPALRAPVMMRNCKITAWPMGLAAHVVWLGRRVFPLATATTFFSCRILQHCNAFPRHAFFTAPSASWASNGYLAHAAMPSAVCTCTGVPMERALYAGRCWRRCIE